MCRCKCVPWCACENQDNDFVVQDIRLRMSSLFCVCLPTEPFYPSPLPNVIFKGGKSEIANLAEL